MEEESDERRSRRKNRTNSSIDKTCEKRFEGEFAGYLEKQGFQWRIWSKRYFVLSRLHLRYYTDDSCEKVTFLVEITSALLRVMRSRSSEMMRIVSRSWFVV